MTSEEKEFDKQARIGDVREAYGAWQRMWNWICIAGAGLLYVIAVTCSDCKDATLNPLHHPAAILGIGCAMGGLRAVSYYAINANLNDEIARIRGER